MHLFPEFSFSDLPAINSFGPDKFFIEHWVVGQTVEIETDATWCDFSCAYMKNLVPLRLYSFVLVFAVRMS